MAVPNIESIAKSLRDCALSSVRGAVPPPQPVEKQELPVEINPDTVFLNNRKQCLDMTTGKLFYINLKSGERKTEFPSLVTSALPSYYSSEENNSDASGDNEDEEENDGDIEDCSSLAGSGSDYEDFFCVNSRNSYSSSSPVSDVGDQNCGASGLILVVAGCKSCFIYFMVPKGVEVCPKCGGCLLHFD